MNAQMVAVYLDEGGIVVHGRSSTYVLHSNLIELIITTEKGKLLVITRHLNPKLRKYRVISGISTEDSNNNDNDGDSNNDNDNNDDNYDDDDNNNNNDNT